MPRIQPNASPFQVLIHYMHL